MPKRAQRRHHEERIKERKRDIAKRWAGTAGQWIVKRTIKWITNDKWVPYTYLDGAGAVERLKYIDRTTNRLAHHNKCPCGMCHKERYDRRNDAPPIDDE